MRFVKCDVCGHVIEPEAPIMHFGVFDAIKNTDIFVSDMFCYHPVLGEENAQVIELCQSCYNGIFREGRTLVDMARTLATEV